jgi:hypothetical protein
MKKITLAAVAAFAIVSTAASAAWWIDEGGFGFVGKGDVQLAFGGKNDAWLQNNAAGISFVSTTSADASWTCSWTNPAGREVVTPRAQTSTTTAVVSSIARDNKNNKVTGFNLRGFGASGATTVTAGQALYSCPSTFTYDEGSFQSTSTGSTLSVSLNGGTPIALLPSI